VAAKIVDNIAAFDAMEQPNPARTQHIGHFSAAKCHAPVTHKVLINVPVRMEPAGVPNGGNPQRQRLGRARFAEDIPRHQELAMVRDVVSKQHGTVLAIH
jgi:hypothetical protein